MSEFRLSTALSATAALSILRPEKEDGKKESKKSKDDTKLVVVKSDDSVRHALRKLNNKNIFAAPIIHDKSLTMTTKFKAVHSKSEKNEQMLEFFSVMDALQVVVTAYLKDLAKSREKSADEPLISAEEATMDVLEEIWSKWDHKLSKHALGFDLGSRWVMDSKLGDESRYLSSKKRRMPLGQIIKSSSTVLELLEEFASPHAPKRIILSDVVGRKAETEWRTQVKGVITQSDLVRHLTTLLAPKDGKVHPFALKSLADIGLSASKPVIFATLEQRAIAAFHTMWLHNIEALPVLAEDRTYLGIIGVQDLATLSFSTIPSLLGTVGKWVKNSFYAVGKDEAIVTNNARLVDVLQAIQFSKSHRVFIRQMDSFKICGIVTLTDVINAVWKHVQEQEKEAGS